MRRITLLFIMLLVGLSVHSQGFVENFDDPSVVVPTGATWPIPSGTWRIFDNGVGSVNWTLSASSEQFPANTAPNAAFINRQNINQGNTSIDYLVSPLSEVPDNPQLRFNTRTTVAGNNFTTFEIRIAPGTADPSDPASFTTVLQTWADDALVIPFNVYQEKVIDLDPALAGTDIYIAFVKVYTQPTAGIDGERWLVDDVRFIEACLDADIETLAADATTATSATLVWDGTGASQWQVHVLPVDDTFNPTAGTPVTVNTNPTTTVTGTTQGTIIGAFTPLTCYKFYVRSICEYSTGEWVGPFEFCTQALPPECGGNFVDDGGIDNDYALDTTSTITICPDSDQDVVTVTFTSFSVESNWDGMYVYDGDGINDPLIPSENGPGFNFDLDTPGAYWGNEIPGPFESSVAGGCLTFQFISDSFGTQDGWTANVTCGPAPTCPKPTELTAVSATDLSVTLEWTYGGPAGATFEIIALPDNSPAPTAASVGIDATGGSPFTYPGLTSATCYDFYVRAHCSDTDVSSWSLVESYCTQITPPECGGVFVDAGGAQNYPPSSNTIWTICPEEGSGDIVTVTFTAFQVETNWDALYVFDGDSTSAPQIASENPANNVPGGLAGGYWGTANPGPFESSVADGCLTFWFRSDTAVQQAGWTANVTCGPPPTCPKPTGIQVGTPTDTTVTVTWNEVAPSVSWQVYALPCGSPAPTVTTPGFVGTTDNQVELIDLDSATCYDIWVIGVCTDTDASVAAGPVDVTTQVAPPVCGGNFIDQGGPANYPNSSNSIVTICPEDGQQVTVTFTQFSTETNWDGLYVFDGDSTSAPQVSSGNPAANVPGGLPGAFWGNTIPGPFTSSSPDGCLTFWFRSDTSVNLSGWLANVTCDPQPPCPRPWGVNIISADQTSATVNWTEVGSATQWQVLVLPAGSPAPAADATGWQTANSTTYTYQPLASGTQWQVYVRAVCSPTETSPWSNPASFNTQISNDDCFTAINVPVNPNASCAQVVGGTLIGATPSTQPTQCVGTADDDVWFTFTAQATTHYISLLDVTGSTTFLTHAVYTGSCDGLTLVECTDGNESVLNDLVPNQVYYIRVYTWTSTGNQTSSFNVCVGTIPPPISTNDTEFTTQELISNVLINSNCATVSNITTLTGTDFGSVNGIGYFNKNGSTFPFDEGVVMSTGSILSAPGPNDEVLSEGPFEGWPGDTDLENIITAATGVVMESNNATVMEFDFVPITPQISFDFIFASEEYGQFQCLYSDAFAFILTNVTAGTAPTNLAVLPSSTTPVSVVTIRDEAYNGDCDSQNPQYFDEYYELPEGLSPLGAPINFRGVTVPLTATSPVVPGDTYHIKLVIADRLDNAYDSAVFLEKGSFNFGNIELGQDFLEADGTALCDGVEFTLSSGLEGDDYSFVWTLNGEVIDGAIGSSIVVTEPGDYGVTATFQNTTCSATDTVTIEYFPPVVPTTPANLIVCNSLGFGEFTLSNANAEILTGLDASDFTVTYYATLEEANTEVGTPLPNAYTNTVANQQIIYAHVESSAGCFGVVPVTLVVQDLAPTFTVTPTELHICENSSGTISVVPGNFDPAAVTYSWTLEGQPLPDTTQTITVTVAGTYEVTVNNAGCTGTATVEVTIGDIVTDVLPDVTVCDVYVLPSLSANNHYWTGAGCTGTELLAGSEVTTTQVIYICSSQGTCVGNTEEFQVTVNHTPVLAPVTNLSGCTVTLPALTVGQYYTDPLGVGPITDLTFDEPGTYTVYVYAETGTSPNCPSANPSFTVTVDPNTVTLAFAQGCQGNAYVLTATPSGGSSDPAGYSYEWTAGATGGSIVSGGATATPTVSGAGLYSVTVTTPEGCTGTDSVAVEATNCMIQKGISANGDGVNDFFDLEGFGVSRLQIFNRYGAKVYERSDYTNQWRGQSDKGDELPDGTYYYVIERTGGEPTETGWIYINRKN